MAFLSILLLTAYFEHFSYNNFLTVKSMNCTCSVLDLLRIVPFCLLYEIKELENVVLINFVTGKNKWCFFVVRYLVECNIAV